MCYVVGIEDAIVQLTVQMSRSQQQLEEKKRQHSILQFEMQDLTLQDQSHHYPAPPSYPGNGQNDILPDFSSMSLEDADWFHEGIPRYAKLLIINVVGEPPAWRFGH